MKTVITNAQVTGLRELWKAFEQFPEKTEQIAYKVALTQSAKEISKIIPTMPTFPYVRTGALLRSIRVTSVRQGRIGPVLLITVGSSRTRSVKSFWGEKTRVKEDAYYARFLEKGTKFIDPPRKFFESAITVGSPRAQRTFVDVLKNQLSRFRSGSL